MPTKLQRGAVIAKPDGFSNADTAHHCRCCAHVGHARALPDVHRIDRRRRPSGGDFSHGNGSGGESIFGETFEDEGFLHRHNRAGLLSMANAGVDTNGSQFFITLAPAPHLDGLHVIFGEVIKGMEIVQLIEQIDTRYAARAPWGCSAVGPDPLGQGPPKGGTLARRARAGHLL